MSQPNSEIYVVYHPHYINYAALKWRRYCQLREGLEILPPGPITPQRQEAVDEWCAEGTATILFCALALESMGYHICHEWFGEAVAVSRFGQCSPVRRWFEALHEKFGRTFDKQGEPYRLLKETFEIRNNLAHRKSKSNQGPPIDAAMAVSFRPDWAEIAVKALRAVPAEALRITNNDGFRQESEMIDRLFAT
ncbi:hypothetical protein BH09VER1_BH09VER1_26130 [soil metagenome]